MALSTASHTGTSFLSAGSTAMSKLVAIEASPGTGNVFPDLASSPSDGNFTGQSALFECEDVNVGAF